jgi:hypothetical protein
VFGLDERIAALSTGASLWIVLAVAVLLGLRHATDPDHLAAVTRLIAGDPITRLGVPGSSALPGSRPRGDAVRLRASASSSTVFFRNPFSKRRRPRLGSSSSCSASGCSLAGAAANSASTRTRTVHGHAGEHSRSASSTVARHRDVAPGAPEVGHLYVVLGDELISQLHLASLWIGDRGSLAGSAFDAHS